MKVAQLRALLADLVSISDSLGKSSSTKDILLFSDFLEKYDSLEIKKLISTISNTAQPAKARSSTSKLANVDVVNRYANELGRQVLSQDQFDGVIERMKKDKAVRVAELKEIVKLYTNTERNITKKQDLFSALVRFYLENLREKSVFQKLGDVYRG